MLSDVTRISVVPQPATLGTCELCATDAAELGSAVVVQHTRGGAVQFAACVRCALAVRRLAAAAGGQARFASAAESGAVVVPTGGVSRRRATVRAGRPQFVHEFVEHLRDADGTEYVVRVYAQPRTGGTWLGSIEFVGVGTDRRLRAAQETTQSSREDVAYWASGLQASYLEGAFRRARRVRRTP